MKIVLIGQAAFAQQVLDGLRGNGHEIAAVYCPPDAAGRKPDPTRARALELGIPVHQHKSLKGAEVEAEVAGCGADLAVLAYVTQIVPQNVFERPRLGSICFHPSLLPKYRGGSAVNWQIIRGETETGVSVFWVDPGIDTGPLLLQRRAAIRPTDTAGSLYYDTLFPLGVRTVIDSVELIAAGNPPREVQDESLATYDPLCRDEHGRVDWSRPARETYDQIRGCDPQPGAHALILGRQIRLFDVSFAPGGTHEPGVIEAITDEGMAIGAPGGAIRVGRVRLDGGKITAAEFAAAEKVAPGMRLDNAV